MNSHETADLAVNQALHVPLMQERAQSSHLPIGISLMRACLFSICFFQFSGFSAEAFLSPRVAFRRHHHSTVKPVDSCRSRLYVTPPLEDENSSQFPSMMEKISINGHTNLTGAETAFVDNGEMPTSNGSKLNGATAVNTTASLADEETGEAKKNVSPTAPEVNNWTTIMGGDFLQKKQRDTVDQIYKDLSDMSEYDYQQVELYWDTLLPAVSYLGTERVAKIFDALRVAYRAHRGQMRKSGEPFIIHPVEVASLLAGLKMDKETVMAGLLHDTVEDTDLSFELVEEMFGSVVRSIVEGETKVSKLPKLAFAEYADEQAENLRQMFVAMTDDYRIIIVKLADRLHNMRTLRHMKPEKQIKISRETLDIFAPLAHRMGIWQFKSELEDTAFMYLYPQEYKRLSRRLRQRQKNFEKTLEESQKILRDRLTTDRTLKDQALAVSVSGRTKEIYSLWHKMETKGDRDIDHIVDVVALRVVITPKPSPDEDENAADRGVWLCYHVLGLVQHLDGFQPVPTRVKDYISFPKPNGYQSLHTALILNGQKIEVQIRTSMMHQVAEYGMASHWAYKDLKQRQGGNEDVFNTPWLSSIKEWQNEKLNARDFVDSVRNELLGKRVFVFLRNGKILNLARGATAIDAAFQIHSEVGLNMHAVEINGKPVPISYELQNGDVVSILTGEGKPSIDWMRYAKSRSTRSKLRSYFRSKQKERYENHGTRRCGVWPQTNFLSLFSLREAGQILLLDYLWMHGPLIEKDSYLEDEFSIPTTVNEIDSMLPGNTQYDDIDELLVTIGKQPDRTMLHAFVSKLFKVPQRILVEAEENRKSFVPTSVLDAVQDNRNRASHAAAAVEQDGTESSIQDASWPKPSISANDIESARMAANGTLEYADPEHLCPICLPIYGDEIIGTRIEGNDDSTPKVHRMGCPHAQRVVNRSLAGNRGGEGFRIDSVSLRRSVRNPALLNNIPSEMEIPVKLEWGEFSGPGETVTTFHCEIVVHAEDRKLLLADCSEVVSELSEILKTGSQTTNEHATLAFLISVQGVEELQKVMDSLRQIRSVMSVERVVSTLFQASEEFS